MLTRQTQTAMSRHASSSLAITGSQPIERAMAAGPSRVREVGVLALF
jgi:hypothetical protein